MARNATVEGLEGSTEDKAPSGAPPFGAAADVSEQIWQGPSEADLKKAQAKVAREVKRMYDLHILLIQNELDCPTPMAAFHAYVEGAAGLKKRLVPVSVDQGEQP